MLARAIEDLHLVLQLGGREGGAEGRGWGALPGSGVGF